MDLAARKRELDRTVKGFMTPIFQRENPDGRMLNGLGPDDFNRCMAGYGCPDCLAIFTGYMAVCPVCGFRRNVAADVEAPPDYWVQHLKDRADPNFGVTHTKADIDKVLKEIHADPEVEQIPLKKLKPTRRYKPPTEKER